ncbi:MAG: iron-sulfur cluster assembly scaffold protein [Gammaproteobacteria bacterium]|nr:iron-sulfur cluster assembly scaffold protein [Gammaproteobacteria bacterium]
MGTTVTGYHANVWQHFRAPRNAGMFAPGTPGVVSGRAGNAQHGREVEMALRLDEDARILECRYRVYGCPATIALCSLASEALRGQPLAAAATYSVLALAESLRLAAEKRAAALVVEDALREAAAGYNGPLPPYAAATVQAKQV